MQKIVWPPFGKVTGVKVKRLLDTLLAHGHLTLGSTRDIHRLMWVAVLNVGHALLRP